MPDTSSDILEQSPLQTKKNDRLMNRKLAARYIGVSSGSMSVWDCTKKYDFKPVKIGGRVYYWQSVLDAWLSEQLTP
ncbi:helix-turn-helix transcriptional regulator [Flavobacterium sp. 3HN19-14]|uniref:helix-turn-helix transcriptional regulator n=1 Tax=Flavobacterium sp. 3HN19-14 TaxID=3448133 RepID=UPI003EE23A8D